MASQVAADAAETDDDDDAPTARETAVMNRLASVLDEYCLSRIGRGVAMAYLRKLPEPDMERVRNWWLRKLNKSDHRPPPNAAPHQRGCPELLEGLRARPVWWRGKAETTDPPEELSWLRDVEAAVPAIRKELLALRRSDDAHFQPYRSPGEGGDALGKKSTDSGDWNVFYLELHNMDFSEHRDRCPETCAVLGAVPRAYGHAFYSSAAPRTHITAHNGPTSKKLRCHLPLVCPDDGSCRLRVADDVVEMAEGKAVIFDDSFNHEAWNDNETRARIVLIFDVWHPDLSAREVKLLGFLQAAAMRRDKKICDARGVDDDNFYAIIDKGRGVRSDDAAVWVGTES